MPVAKSARNGRRTARGRRTRCGTDSVRFVRSARPVALPREMTHGRRSGGIDRTTGRMRSARYRPQRRSGPAGKAGDGTTAGPMHNEKAPAAALQCDTAPPALPTRARCRRHARSTPAPPPDGPPQPAQGRSDGRERTDMHNRPKTAGPRATPQPARFGTSTPTDT